MWGRSCGIGFESGTYGNFFSGYCTTSLWLYLPQYLYISQFRYYNLNYRSPLRVEKTKTCLFFIYFKFIFVKT